MRVGPGPAHRRRLVPAALTPRFVRVLLCAHARLPLCEDNWARPVDVPVRVRISLKRRVDFLPQAAMPSRTSCGPTGQSMLSTRDPPGIAAGPVGDEERTGQRELVSGEDQQTAGGIPRPQ